MDASHVEGLERRILAVKLTPSTSFLLARQITSDIAAAVAPLLSPSEEAAAASASDSTTTSTSTPSAAAADPSLDAARSRFDAAIAAACRLQADCGVPASHLAAMTLDSLDHLTQRGERRGDGEEGEDVRVDARANARGEIAALEEGEREDEEEGAAKGERKPPGFSPG